MDSTGLGIDEMGHDPALMGQHVQGRFQPSANAHGRLARREKSIGFLRGQRQRDPSHAGGREAAQTAASPWTEIALAVENESRRRLIIEEVLQCLALQAQQQALLPPR